ncbi:molybdenum ABC transporter ATP-binding protein [Ideonella sp. BN130291]|uniref:molybdenum ABC transporter ATP-binding protein n=1 Tax=Ideonella sp. BN130291 TaxID=3112940 RepID=UPI002E271055|nr:molybdenum ABC transporter ATP-binding protein [Ideonella sp. BN130291]
MSLHADLQLTQGQFTLRVDFGLPLTGVTAIFGPSGSGKTSLLRCIAGLERSARGRLLVGDDVWQDDGSWLPPHRRPVGYVFQEASLFPHLSVRRNLLFGHRRAASAAAPHLDHLVEQLGIATLLDRMPERLSGGERQRVAIARALAVGPRLLLMDEPLSGLDNDGKQELMPCLERLRDELRIPILYVSHAPAEVARLADQVVLMEGGRVTGQGPLGDTLSQLHPALRLGDERGVVIPTTVAQIDAQWHLARLAFDGGELWTPDHGLAPGQRARVHVLARDVSLAREHAVDSSIQNVLRGRIDGIADEAHPGLALVRVQVGSVHLLARLTRRALASLDARVGQAVWVQVKTVALAD